MDLHKNTRKYVRPVFYENLIMPIYAPLYYSFAKKKQMPWLVFAFFVPLFNRNDTQVVPYLIR